MPKRKLLWVAGSAWQVIRHLLPAIGLPNAHGHKKLQQFKRILTVVA